MSINDERLQRETMEQCDKCHGFRSVPITPGEEQKTSDKREWGEGYKTCTACKGRGHK